MLDHTDPRDYTLQFFQHNDILGIYGEIPNGPVRGTMATNNGPIDGRQSSVFDLLVLFCGKASRDIRIKITQEFRDDSYKHTIKIFKRKDTHEFHLIGDNGEPKQHPMRFEYFMDQFLYAKTTNITLDMTPADL